MNVNDATTPRPGLGRLFLVSFIALFLEVALIRWIAVEIRIFAYFSNLILVSGFIGFGIGFNLTRVRFGLSTSIFLIAGLVLAALPEADFHGVSLRRIPEYLAFKEYVIWMSAGAATWLRMAGGFLLLSLVVVVVAMVFVPFGQALAEIFAASDHRVRDYSINLLGSLLGTWTFAWLSYLSFPAWTWFLVGVGGTLAIDRPWSRRQLIALAALVPILLGAMDRDTPTNITYWSPYQKLVLSVENYIPKEDPSVSIQYRYVKINSVFYMNLLDLSPAQFERYPTVLRQEDAPYYPYDLNYRFCPRPDRVLIVGAGAGNDAAAALRNGAKEVDAVEIDPQIAELGILYHPERPYEDKRVNLIVDDARSFFKKSKRTYDLIIFGLLDSHTMTSNFTNISLDSYVYTLESFQEAKRRLAPGGVLCVSFAGMRPWQGAKFKAMLERAFGATPLIVTKKGGIQGTPGTMLVAGDQAAIAATIDADPRFARIVAETAIDPQTFSAGPEVQGFDLPTDDWPHIYIKSRRVPTLYIVMILALAALMYAAVRVAFPAGRIGSAHFLFLGAGFMLLEVHSISKAALLFGATWIVNVIIISAILTMALLSNLVVLKWRPERMGPWYAGLFAALVLNYLVPVNQLFIGSYLVRGALIGAFYALPIFFAGVIFAGGLRRAPRMEVAFASNMMGAAIGGMLEAGSFMIGIKAMVLVAIVLYVASAVALRGSPKIGGSGPAPAG